MQPLLLQVLHFAPHSYIFVWNTSRNINLLETCMRPASRPASILAFNACTNNFVLAEQAQAGGLGMHMMRLYSCWYCNTIFRAIRHAGDCACQRLLQHIRLSGLKWHLGTWIPPAVLECQSHACIPSCSCEAAVRENTQRKLHITAARWAPRPQTQQQQHQHSMKEAGCRCCRFLHDHETLARVQSSEQDQISSA